MMGTALALCGLFLSELRNLPRRQSATPGTPPDSG